MKLLVIGGYGSFGARLIKRLKDEAGLEIYVAGRSAEKAKSLCKDVTGKARLQPLAIDKQQSLEPQLSFVPDIIIDTAGPFQKTLCGQDNPVMAYALKHGLIYFDLSDDRGFIAETLKLDTDAKRTGAVLVSGLSTYPTLTAAAVEEIERHHGRVTSLWGGIAPSPRLPMGRNVIAAIASYAGEPKAGARQDGKLTLEHGFTHTRKTPITPGGTIPLGPILFSNVDAPEALALPQHVQNIEMMAGPRPTVLHRILVLLSRLRKRRLFPKLSLFTGMMNTVQKILSIGDGRSGMIVSTDTVKSGFVSWHLIASDPDGPNIPILPAAILVKKILRGETLSPGAYHGGGQVSLTEFRKEWQDLKIIDGIHAKPRGGDSIYKQCLGEAWDTLPPSLQELHSVKDHASYKGRANIVRGRNPLAHLVAGIFHFPKPGTDIPVTLNFTVKNRVERWERIFGNHAPMVSTQQLGHFSDDGTIIERFGPIAVAIALIAEPEGRLRNKTIAWYLFGLPMPKFLCPGGDIYEYEKDGVFHFHVDIRAPLFGRLVKYEGWLKKS